MYHLTENGEPICGAKLVVSLAEPEGLCATCRKLASPQVPQGVGAAQAPSASIAVRVDPGWIDFVTGSNLSGDGVEGSTDVFLRMYSGYWLYGALWLAEKGWLGYDCEGLQRRPTDEEYEVAVVAFRDGQKLPEHWYVLNREVAEKAWVAGVKRWGERWYEDGDGGRYDWALQMGLFGEAVYG